MGCWDTACIICGAPPHGVYKDNPNTTNERIKQTKWLHECTIMTTDGAVYHNLKELACNVMFSDGKTEFTSVPFTFDTLVKSYSHSGCFLHTDCWKYIKRITGHSLN